MKKVLVVLLPAGLALVAALLLLGAWRERSSAFDARLERARIKREFAERSAMARSLPAAPNDAWREESAALLRWYLEAQAAVRNRHPEEPARPTAVETASEEKRGGLAEKDRAAILDFQKYADDRFTLLKSGRYAPVASALTEGLRLDLVAVQPGPSPDGGGPALRIDFALWGAPRLVERETTGEKTASRTVMPVALKRLAFRFLDQKGTLWGEMNGSGEPYQKLADPERFVEDFPPAVLFGTWWVDLLPRPPTTVELSLEASLRGASGKERPAEFRFALPIDESWRLPPGAAYQAEVREGAAPPPR